MINTLHQYADICPVFNWENITEINIETMEQKNGLLRQAQEVLRKCRVYFIDAPDKKSLAYYGQAIKELDKLVRNIHNIRVDEKELDYYR